MTRVVSISIRNRAIALLVLLALVGLGVVMLTVGLALLSGLTIAGGVIGAGIAAYRALRGGRGAIGGRSRGAQFGSAGQRLTGLDPSLEVRSVGTTVVKPAHDGDATP